MGSGYKKIRHNWKWLSLFLALIVFIISLFIINNVNAEKNTKIEDKTSNDSVHLPADTIYYTMITTGSEIKTDLMEYNVQTKKYKKIISKSDHSIIMIRYIDNQLYAIVDNNVASISPTGKISYITNGDDYVLKYRIYNHKVYFGKDNTNASDDIFEQFAMKNLDGSDEKILSISGISQLIVDKDGIFFAPNSGADAGKIIIKYDLDGNKLLTIEVNDIRKMIKVDDYIYYINYSEKNAIYKIKIDGTNNVKVTTKSADYTNILYSEISGMNNFGIIDNYLYYVNSNKVYKINIDGTHNQSVSNINIRSMYVKGEYIYYTIKTGDKLYIMDKNGKNSQTLLTIGYSPEYTIK